MGRNDQPRPIGQRGVALLLIVVGIGLCGGCGDGLASVRGQVLLDGAPLTGGGDTRAMVYLYPEGGTGAPAVGLVDENGEFSVSTGAKRGVEPGAYLVTISASRLIGEDVPGVPRSAERLTPPKYADPRRSGLRVEVDEGSNEYEFALKSEPVIERNPRRRRRSG